MHSVGCLLSTADFPACNLLLHSSTRSTRSKYCLRGRSELRLHSRLRQPSPRRAWAPRFSLRYQELWRGPIPAREHEVAVIADDQNSIVNSPNVSVGYHEASRVRPARVPDVGGGTLKNVRTLIVESSRGSCGVVDVPRSLSRNPMNPWCPEVAATRSGTVCPIGFRSCSLQTVNGSSTGDLDVVPCCRGQVCRVR